MNSISTTLTLMLSVMTFIIVGCSSDSVTSPVKTVKKDPVEKHDDHAHPTKGPHQGGLIELGNEEYHAELVHNEDTGTVTIYILDGAAKNQVPIDTTDVTINATHDGKPEQFKLTASPDTNDPDGKSSRFISNDKELAHHLDEEESNPRLVLSINGKSYRGNITHDHEGHDH